MKPLGTRLVLMIALTAAGCGRAASSGTPTDMAMAEQGQARVKWTIDGSTDTNKCQAADATWDVLVDGVLDVHAHSISCANEAWTSGVLQAAFGSRQFTVKLMKPPGTVVGTKSATADITTNDPNTIVNVNIAFTSADF